MKRVTIRKAKLNSKGTQVGITPHDKASIMDMAMNESLTRADLMNKLLDPRRDINLECGYPATLGMTEYKLMYDREGIATRVVNIFPEESWTEDPEIIENEESDDTEFEKVWKELEKERKIYSYMLKIDRLSGIGRFGILLLGLNDGKELNEAVEGIDDKGEKSGNAKLKLLYLRVFDESLVKVKTIEKDATNPRFGQPTSYTITFETVSTNRSEDGQSVQTTSMEQMVHWSRVIHMADNRENSEIYGVPRMQTLYNRLYDIRKIVGGSGEMFWKGGFPGYSFEMDPQARPMTTDEETALTTTLANWMNGLQRYITTQGIKVNSLEPQVADPKAHTDVQLEIIAIALGVPKRIFMGAEQAKLASTQDTISWNKRIAKRQKKYVSPYVIRPVIDRLIVFGVLPEVKEYDIEWSDLDTPSDMDKAEVLAKKMEAYAKYVGGGVDALIPEEIFFKMIVGLDADQIEEIMKAVEERESDLEGEEEEARSKFEEEDATAIDEEKKRQARIQAKIDADERAAQ